MIKISKTCRRISVGCSYEPLMAKNIDEYLETTHKYINEYIEHMSPTQRGRGLIGNLT